MAIYNTTTNYPTTVDDLVFISDVDCKSENIMEQHQYYVSKGLYTEASNYLNSQTEITPIVASLFNLLENRIVALQTYLLEQESVNRAYYEQPSNPVNNSIWIK